MEKFKEILGVVMGSCLIVDGQSRTYAKAPMWLAVLGALISPHLALLTAVLIIAFGMRARIVKA